MYVYHLRAVPTQAKWGLRSPGIGEIIVVRSRVSAGKIVVEEQQVLLMAEPPLPTPDFNF